MDAKSPPVVIGISCDFETATDRRGTTAGRHQLCEDYIRALAAAGAAAVLLPHQDPAHAAACLAPLAGLVVSGGDMDVPPDFYQQTPRPGLRRLVAERSRFERALLQEAWARRLPTLGVCCGMQLMNVVLGGSLHQDLAERPGTAVHEQPLSRRQPHHPLRVDPTARGLVGAAAQAGPTGTSSAASGGGGAAVTSANSTHHQIVDRVAPPLRPVAWSPDGVVEAIECPDRPFWLGVQWHPEALGPGPHWQIYAGLVEAAQRQAAGSAPTR